jgi:hypothetical protein
MFMKPNETVIGLAIAIAGAWMACSPGEPPCDELGNLCTGGAGGAPPKIKDPPASCGPLGVTETTGSIKALDQFESNYFVTKCGTAKCHGPGGIFPPKNMHMPAMIRPSLVGKKALAFCKEDFYIDKIDVTKSYLLHKIEATGDTLQCPTPGEKPDSGGTRMPNKEGLPGTQGDRLPDEEIECFSWWVEAAASL